MDLPWEDFQNTDTATEAKPWETYAPSLEPQVVTPDQPRMGLADMLFDPQVAQNIRGAIQDVVYSLPGMAAQLPEMAYQGLKFAAGGPQEKSQVAEQALTEAKIQGQQMAADVQAPLGSRESFRGIANIGMMSVPAVSELLGESVAGLRGKLVNITPEDVIPGQIRTNEIPSTIAERAPIPTSMEGMGKGTRFLQEGKTEGGGETRPPIQALPQIPETPITDLVTQQPKGEPNAIEQSNAQVQGRETPLGIETRPESGLPTASDSNNVIREAQGAEAGRALPQEVAVPQPEQPVSEGGAGTPTEIGATPETPTTVSQTTPEGQAKSDEYSVRLNSHHNWEVIKNGNPYDVVGQREYRLKSQADSVLEELQKPSPVSKSGVELPAPISKEPESIENLVSQVERMPTSRWAGYDFTPEEKAAILAREAAEAKAATPVSKPNVSTTVEPQLKTEAPKTESASVTPPTEPPTESPPVSTKNAYTEEQRAARGFPEAEQAAKRDFGTMWDEAAAEAKEDPSIGRRLVDELNSKPRTISDTENAHLLRTQIEAQREHSAAVEAVNTAKTPEDLTAAKSRLELARQDLQDVYDATKRAGTKSGQALAARQMLAKEDYTLAAMEARRRAANNGLPLNEKQLSEVNSLHEKIADLQSKLDAHEVAQKFNAEFSRLVNEAKKDARASRATTKFNDFMDRKAAEARQRIVDRRGRLTTGFDPSSIADEAIIGASHIAKGITKFADWSVKMVDEFGDAVRPFLKDIWEKAKAFHAETAKEYGEKALARYKTYLSKQTEQIKGKIEAGDFTKAERQRTKLDAEAFTMRANLQKLKNEFERGVAKEAYQKKSPAQKFWDHFVGVERAMKLSGPEVFGKLGVAAAVREAVIAPVESGVGYGYSKLFPRLAAGTKYGADLSTVIRSEIKAKAAMFTKGMQDAAQNVKGKETELDAISGSKIRPDFWYNRIGQMHAAIKAPVKRAEFTRSLEQRMNAAVKNGEDIYHPEVMTRLANEAVIDANRAIFQQNTIVSNFFAMIDKKFPAGGRVARFLQPVVKIPVNLFKEFVGYHVNAPIGAIRVGQAYWKGVETLPPVEREAILRQLTKGSVGGAALLWSYFNSDKVRKFFDNVPQWFNHTPIAMILNEGSYLKKLQGTDPEKKESQKELAYMAKTDIPFMYSVKNITDALDTHNSHALQGWINNMVQSTVVPQLSTQVAKTLDKPGSFPSNLSQRPTYRVPSNPLEAVKLGVPGLRQTVPEKTAKPKGHNKSGTYGYTGQ